MVNDVLRLFEELKDVQEKGLPWHVAGRLMREWARRPENWTQRDQVWARCFEATGMSAVMLKRYLKTYTDVLRLAEVEGVDPETLMPSGFTATELAVRLAERNRSAGLRMLVALRSRQAKIEDVRKELKETQAAAGFSERGKTLQWRASTTRFCDAALRDAAEKLFGEGTSIDTRKPLRLLPRIGYEIRTAGGDIAAGADLYLGETPGGGGDPLEDLCGSALLAAHLPSYWIVLAPTIRKAAANDLAAVLPAMAEGAGILRIGPDATVAVARPAVIRPERGGYAALIDGLTRRFSAKNFD